MPIPAAYQLALEIFDLASDTSAARRQVWEQLAPLMDQIVKEHEQLTMQFTPYYRDLIENRRQRNAELIITFTERLFTQPFDDAWVASTKERVKAEREIGFDMRARSVIANTILSNLDRALLRKRWWSKRRCITLAGLATRVLTMDSNNAAIIHYHIEARTAENKINKLDSAIVNFGTSIESVREAITVAVNALNSTSRQLANLANRAADEALKGSTIAENAATNAGQIAAATEELNASIAEIRHQANLACLRAQEAAADASDLNEVVHLLSQSVGKIGSVVNLIADIASQTNLLALNATIEAARAGQHGRGFAVVASEVKTLAGQTADATKHIADQIALIEQTTQKSIHEIGETTSKISEIATTSRLVEDSVSEHAAASSEIAVGTNNAARNATEAAVSLKTVTLVVNSTKDSAGLVLESARRLFDSMRKMDEAMDSLLRASQDAGIQQLADLKKNLAAS